MPHAAHKSIIRRVTAGRWLALPLLAVFMMWGLSAFASGSDAVIVPPPTVDEAHPVTSGMETAVLAGGCFWGVQGVFQHVKGVNRAVSGYSGGDSATAEYETVSTGTTGHAESVEITYDPKTVTYGQLLRIYFSVATDPTELNRQGPDRGTQYRGAVFFQNPDQKRIAESYIAQLEKANVFDDKIVTTLEPFKAFYPAEDYHQDFLALNPRHPYIAINDMPKVDNLKRLFPGAYSETPVLVMKH